MRLGLLGGSGGKETVCSAGDPGSIPGLGKSPGEGNGNPLQYCYLGNPMDRGVWRATVHGGHRVGHDGATNTWTCETVSLQTEETVSVAPRQWTVLEGETALTLEPDLGAGAVVPLCLRLRSLIYKIYSKTIIIMVTLHPFCKMYCKV